MKTTAKRNASDDPRASFTPEQRALFKAAAGSDDLEINFEFVKRTFATVWPLDGTRGNRDEMITLSGVVRATMAAFQPTDAVEGLLVAQVVGLHHGAMESMRRATMAGQSVEGAARSWKDAASLSRVLLDTIACLERRRQQASASVTS